MTDPHTPGPWQQFGCEIYGADGTRVAEAVLQRDLRLVREAPELHAALRDLVDVMTGQKDGETAALHNALTALRRVSG